MFHTTYTMAQAKREFKQGTLSKFCIIKIRGVYALTLYSTGGASGLVVDARSSQARAFKTSDSVISALESIGFKIDCLYPQ